MTGSSGARDHRRRRAGRLLAILTAGVVLGAGLVIAQPAPSGPTPSAPPASPAPRPAAVGLRTYYEVVAGTGVTLFELALDGRSQPRAVAHQPGASYGRTFEVDPTGRVMLSIILTDGADRRGAIRIGRVDPATGELRSLGEVEGSAWAVEGVWSADGAWWVKAAEEGGRPRLLVVDIVGGAIGMLPLDQGFLPMAFESGPNLVLVARDEEPAVDRPSLQFVRMNVATGVTTPYPAGVLPQVGGRSWASWDVAPLTGLVVEGAEAEEDDADRRPRLVVHALRTGEERDLGRFDAVSWMAFTPEGDAVVACTDSAFVLLPLEGAMRKLADHPGDGCLDPPLFSVAGTLAAHATWEGRSVLRLFDLRTISALTIPLPEGNAEAHVVGIVGETPLPPLIPPLITGSDGPTARTPIEGAPAVLHATVDTRPDGRRIAHVQLLAPAVEGGTVAIETMPPLHLAEAAGQADVGVSAIPRPGTHDILVRAAWPDGVAMWLWHPGGGVERLTIPDRWPSASDWIVISPDGSRIATTRFDEATGRSGVLTWELATGKVKGRALPDGYASVERWPLANFIAVGYQICTEGCPGRYAQTALLDLTTGKLAPIADDGTSQGLALHFAYAASDREIMLTAINDERSDDRTIAWPEALPPLRDVVVAGPDLVVTAGDPVEGLEVYRLQDAVGRAVAGQGPAAPVLVGRLPAGMLLRSVSEDGRWVRTGGIANGNWLVELATGEAFDLGMVWDPPWAPR